MESINKTLRKVEGTQRPLSPRLTPVHSQ